MRSFSDRNARAWKIELSFALWRRIKGETGIDLLDVAMPDGKALRQLTEMENVGVVLWLYCEEEALAAGIDRETFWRALHGPAIEAAMAALVDDLEDFSQSPQFSALRVAMTEAKAEVERQRAEILDPGGEIGRTIRSVMRSPESPAAPSTRGPAPSNAPASSASTPTGGPSATSTTPANPDDAMRGTVQV